MKFIKETLIKCLGVFVTFCFSLPLLLMRIVSYKKPSRLKNWSYFMARKFAAIFSRYSLYYCMIDFLPKKAGDVTACNLLTDTREHEYAVVIQGPVLKDFTAESIRIYRKILPKAYIIVSTWVNTNEKLVEELRGLADEVILSELPKTSGIGNINYQAKSSYVGMKRTCELGIPYAMKTRTDQRIYTPLAFEYLKSLLEIFPIDESVSHLQKKRIIASSTLSEGKMTRPYYLQDFFYFGDSQDLLNFFDIIPDTRHSDMMTEELWTYIHSFKNWGNYIVEPCPEVGLTKSYIKRFSDGKCESTVKNFWEDIRKRFLIISLADLKMYWPKYNNINFWSGDITKSGQPECDGKRTFLTPLCIALLNGHLRYDSRLEDFNKYIEPFQNLGTFCNGYEYLDEVMKVVPLLRGED